MYRRRCKKLRGRGKVFLCFSGLLPYFTLFFRGWLKRLKRKKKGVVWFILFILFFLCFIFSPILFLSVFVFPAGYRAAAATFGDAWQTECMNVRMYACVNI